MREKVLCAPAETDAEVRFTEITDHARQQDGREEAAYRLVHGAG